MAASRPRRVQAAAADLQAADPVLAEIIDRVGIQAVSGRRRGRPREHYGALVHAIVGQQLSTRAAAAIYARLIAHFGGRPPTPEEVMAADPEQMRQAAGLSRAKVRFLRSLAEHVLDGSLELDRLAGLSDDHVIAELTAVTGLGVWTSHMFLIFHLDRPDVLAVGDLGIRRAMQLNYGLEELPPPARMEAIAEAWRPHRTLACRFLWASLSAAPD